MGSIDNRISFLDNAKILAMFLVVYAHLFVNDSMVRLYIYAFHMPLFFIVSGMLHRDKPIMNQIRKLLIPTAFFIALFLAVSTPMYYLDVWDYVEQYGEPLPKTWPDILFAQCKLLIINIIGGVNSPTTTAGFCWFYSN